MADHETSSVNPDGHVPEGTHVRHISDATPEEIAEALADVHDEAAELHVRGGVAPRSTFRRFSPPHYADGSVPRYMPIGDGTWPDPESRAITRPHIQAAREVLANSVTTINPTRVRAWRVANAIASARTQLADARARIEGGASSTQEEPAQTPQAVGIPKEVRDQARELSMSTGITHKIVNNGDGTFTIEKAGKRTA